MPFVGDYVNNFICPYCECKTPISIVSHAGDLAGNFFHIGKCQNVECQKYIVFVYESTHNFTEGIRNAVNYDLKLVHHYPTKEGNTHESVDVDVAESYKEGVRDLNIGSYKSAVLMFRRALQQICKHKNTTKQKLNEQIDEVLLDSIKELAHEIRQWGNIGGHPDDIIDDVDKPDAIEIKDLLDSAFEMIYITPWKINQRRTKRTV